MCNSYDEIIFYFFRELYSLKIPGIYHQSVGRDPNLKLLEGLIFIFNATFGILTSMMKSLPKATLRYLFILRNTLFILHSFKRISLLNMFPLNAKDKGQISAFKPANTIQHKKSITKQKQCSSLYDNVEKVDLKVDPKDCVFSGTDNGLKIMMSTVTVPLPLYNYYEALHDEQGSESAQRFQPIPKPFNISSKDIDIGTNEVYMRRWRNQRKKRSSADATSHQEVFDIHLGREAVANTLQEFYHSPASIKKKEEQRTFKPRSSRTGLHQKKGNRGTGAGTWKAKIHGRYAASCITNEHNSSQICVYCFKKVVHPKKEKKIHDYVAFKVGQAVQSRDKQSALLISLQGVSRLLRRAPFPILDPKTSHFNTGKTKQQPPLSGTRNEDVASSSKALNTMVIIPLQYCLHSSAFELYSNISERLRILGAIAYNIVREMVCIALKAIIVNNNI
ncbi:hypothetical protein K501DRAFT_267557 [Backusella circina FSU 941]|nr:hypothetical protein K501DRAFT_267557 [Backusella circina FSU 941]